MSEQWDALSADEAQAAANWLKRRCDAVVAQLVEEPLAEMAEEDAEAVEAHGAQAQETIAAALFAVTSLELGVPAHLLDPAALLLGALVPNIDHLVTRALTVPDVTDPGVHGRIGTLFGLAQVAQVGPAHGQRLLAAFEKADLKPGQVGRWTCPLCGTAYPDDYEPDFCPPCGARLTRMRAPTMQEREDFQRQHEEEVAGQGETYQVRRFHRDSNHPEHGLVVERGLTLEEAQAHCQRPDTRAEDAQGTVWFDGYDVEEP